MYAFELRKKTTFKNTRFCSYNSIRYLDILLRSSFKPAICFKVIFIYAAWKTNNWATRTTQKSEVITGALEEFLKDWTQFGFIMSVENSFNAEKVASKDPALSLKT